MPIFEVHAVADDTSRDAMDERNRAVGGNGVDQTYVCQSIVHSSVSIAIIRFLEEDEIARPGMAVGINTPVA